MLRVDAEAGPAVCTSPEALEQVLLVMDRLVSAVVHGHDPVGPLPQLLADQRHRRHAVTGQPGRVRLPGPEVVQVALDHQPHEPGRDVLVLAVLAAVRLDAHALELLGGRADPQPLVAHQPEDLAHRGGLGLDDLQRARLVHPPVSERQIGQRPTALQDRRPPPAHRPVLDLVPLVAGQGREDVLVQPILGPVEVEHALGCRQLHAPLHQVLPHQREVDVVVVAGDAVDGVDHDDVHGFAPRLIEHPRQRRALPGRDDAGEAVVGLDAEDGPALGVRVGEQRLALGLDGPHLALVVRGDAAVQDRAHGRLRQFCWGRGGRTPYHANRMPGRPPVKGDSVDSCVWVVEGGFSRPSCGSQLVRKPNPAPRWPPPPPRGRSAPHARGGPQHRAAGYGW